MAKYFARIGEATYELDIRDGKELTVDGKGYSLDYQAIDPGVFVVRLNSRNYRVLLESGDGELMHVRVLGRSYSVHLQSEFHRRLELASRGASATHAKTEVRAPMAGLIVGVRVQAGDRVQPGSTLLILEAMKMENEIRSVHDGNVVEVRVREGSAVEKGEILVKFQ
ncbi:MAG: biotin/lipoyl-containing protein [Bacteroidota bacterium]